MKAADFRQWVVRPALQGVSLWTEINEELLMGTAAQESGFEHLVQLGGGPARGFFQVEPATYRDLFSNFLVYNRSLQDAALYWSSRSSVVPPADELVWNLRFAAVIAYLIYRRHPKDMPVDMSPEALAKTWKKRYNSPLGAGTEAQFIASYHRLVK